MGHTWRRRALIVGIGGALGTAARHGATEWLPATSWPWPTFIVNVVGSLLLGIVVALFARPDDPRRLLLGTGMLGGFTTYSAFAVETDALLRDGQILTGVLYPVVSVALGMAAAAAGLLLTRRRRT